MSRYDDLDREALVRLLERRDAERPLGLVWERDEIDADRAINDDYVALHLDPALSHGDAPWENLIIEGDNFDALRALRASHKGAIKCIYIDPPYNTGNRDFVYNDRFVDKTHRFRHSLWLEFMYRRLVLAKELLADDGVIFVSIGDDEIFRLGMLMDRVFGVESAIARFIWRKVDSPNDNKVPVTPDHEYVLAYGSGRARPKLLPKEAPEIVAAYGQRLDDGTRYRDRLLKKNGRNSLRRDRPTMYFSIDAPDGTPVFPTHENGEEACWAMGRDGVQRHIDAETLIWKRRMRGEGEVWEPYTREFAPGNPTRPWPSIWSDLPTMRQAKATLRDIFSTSDLFSTPKPAELIERLLRVIPTSDGTVLDFFAGSGTTAHAVAKLNAEDGGNRRFILVSNTEATEDAPDKNLCRDVCAERVRRVMGGYTSAKGEHVAGLGGSFAYLRARRVPKHRLSQKLDHPEIWSALQLLHARPLTPWPGDGFAADDDGDTTFAYLANHYPASRTRMDAWLAARSDRPAVIYSWTPERYRTVESPHDWRPIPQHLRERFGR